MLYGDFLRCCCIKIPLPTKLTGFAFQKSADHIFMKMAALFVRSLFSFRIKVGVIMTLFPIADNLVTAK